jgi:hypothetical protein
MRERLSGTPFFQTSDDWISKTQPNWIGSGAGAGRVKAINKNYLGAGIEPRNWTEAIAEVMEETFADDIQAAIDRGFERARAKGKDIVIDF